ncbi:hypothetical protein [Streptomyces beihaiensis]|uniref:Uncharacterized protein n=1 Tax=Streptomyces beihaiensis TaxID=2984495 RepID=A0ABT3U4J7_9ACTN|nr:hypothetical protein [Streptomyces beihaiensis]MCX3064241.1 hypothetical protein [Streptomyces beihaiensis]
MLTPLFIARLAARDRVRARTAASVPALLTFLVSLGALGVLVLVVYDTALLYNLGRLGERLPIAFGAAAVLAAARLTAARLSTRSAPGLAVTFLQRALRHWLALFFVPALAVRYGVMFGTPCLAAVAGLVPAAAAGGYAVRDTLAMDTAHGSKDGTGARHERLLLLTLVLRLGCAVLVGAGAAYAVTLLMPTTYYEATLLPAAAAFLATAITTCGLLDATGRRAVLTGRDA